MHGIPFGVKDLLDTAGIATTYGAEPFRNRVPAVDSVVVARLTAALEKVLALPDTQARMAAQGVVTGYLNPADSGKRIKAEMDKWTKVAKDANIKLE